MTNSPDEIEILGADANNLRKVDATVPIGKLTAIVGVSGSGKSSLVEGTLAAAAAQRMQHFLNIEVPRVDGSPRAYVGATPPILFTGQRAFRASSRTTVATATGILRVLRRLFLSAARPFADDIGEWVPAASPATYAAWLKKHGKGRATVWATPIVHQATSGTAAAKKLADAGIQEVTVRSETDRGRVAEVGRQVNTLRFKPLPADVRHTLEALVARLTVEKSSQKELEAALERAWRVGSGHVFVELHDMEDPALMLAYSSGLSSRQHVVHPRSPRVYAPPNRHLLSFNSPEHPQSGACAQCLGLGVATGLNESTLIPHPERSMNDGAFALWTQKNYRYVNIQHETIAGLSGRVGFDPSVPWKKLNRTAKNLVLNGSSEPVEDRDPKTGKKVSAPHIFEGFRRAILGKAGRPTPAGAALAGYLHQGPCPACDGTRWAEQARALRVGPWSLGALLSLSISELAAEAQEGTLKRAVPEAKDHTAALARIAAALENVGLGHLSGARGMLEISDGESRRVRIGGVLSSRLAGLLLVLDEPARGLHEKDLDGLGDALLEATRRHTVLISEHRQRLVRRAHRVIEVGPGPGSAGGRVQFQGAPSGVKGFDGRRTTPNGMSLGSSTPWLTIEGVNVHNVADAAVRIPLGKLSCVAGVSGSGKSSFVRGALVPALASVLPRDRVEMDDFRLVDGTWGRLSGHKPVTSLHALDQSSGSVQRRSLVATFVGVADTLRAEFARQPLARRLGLAAGDFGTNAGHGRCPRCLGLGTVEGDDCPRCGGLRFGVEVLSVRAAGWSLAEILSAPAQDLTKAKGPEAFSSPVLQAMVELGVGHLSLGRSLDTLSGGEVQRLRIARALARHDAGGAFFVLDEPAGGLHPTDVERLERALRHMLVDGKNTVVLVEHDPHLLAACDYIVEFGPSGGPSGGKIVAAGSPAEVVKKGKSPTALALTATGASKSKVTTPRRESGRPATAIGEAQVARAQLRQVLGEDVEVADQEELLCPAAFVRDTGAVRPHEIAYLDLQLGAFLLDVQPYSFETSLENLKAVWRESPQCELRIHPLLHEIAEWGRAVPRSVVEECNTHVAAMGLGPSVARSGDLLAARVTGSRFVPAANSDEARSAALHDAWAVGGGYVELATERGQVRASVQDRPMNLNTGVIGPRHPTPAQLSRLDPLGACAACRGSGTQAEPERSLVVAKRSGKILDLASLRPEAGAVLRGVFRSEMVPFFKRLSSEGLWAEATTWASLDGNKDAYSTVMGGFWVRPGHGTFLKAEKLDGSEVNHWLRWDGLTALLRAELSRSKHAAWKEAFESSIKRVACPACNGTGLAGLSTLVQLGDRSLSDWVTRGSLQELLNALKQEKSVSPRAAATRQRLISCLSPIAKQNPKLRAIVAAQDARPVWAKAAIAFTGMALADDP